MEKELFLGKVAGQLPLIREKLGWTQEELAARLGLNPADIASLEDNPAGMGKTAALALFTTVFGELDLKREQYASLNYVLWGRNDSTDREYLLSQINALAWGLKPAASVLVIGPDRDPLAGKTAHLIRLLSNPAEAGKSAMLNQQDIARILERTVQHIEDDLCECLGLESPEASMYIKNLEGITYHLGSLDIEFNIGDISDQADIDIICNASDKYLSGSGGGDRSVHQAAGPQLEEACQPLVPVQPGQAVATPAFLLPNKLIIHCVGPNYKLDQMAPELLASCYRNSMRLAETQAAQHGYSSLALPSIATGTFGYPVKQAAPIALETILGIIPTLQVIKKIRFVLFDSGILSTYVKTLEAMLSAQA